MASLKIIKKRITSVKSTQKITRAMKLVSAAKLKRAQERAQQSRPFEAQMLDMVSSILYEARWASPLTEKREAKRVLFVVYSSDRGLCGSLNSNVFKLAMKRIQELQGAKVSVIALGKKSREFFARRGVKVFSHVQNLVREGSPEAMAMIANQIRQLFVGGEFDKVEVFYPRFQSAIAQKPTRMDLLPFVPGEAKDSGLCLYEPGPTELLDSLVPMMIDFQMYRFLLEMIACEHAARMAAMESATKNSKEMIERLTLARNRVRQAVITRELMEIIGGADALAASA